MTPFGKNLSRNRKTILTAELAPRSSMREESIFRSCRSAVFNYLERKHVKLHLMNAEEIIKHADTRLPPKLKENRQKMLEILHEYQNNEIFPQNTRHSRKTPMIKGDNGRLCAVAYMIERSGNKELVDQLSALNNLVRIREVHDGPLLKWLSEWGLSQEEAATIQPEYGCNDPFCTSSMCACYAANITLIIIITILSSAVALFAWRIFRGRKRGQSE